MSFIELLTGKNKVPAEALLNEAPSVIGMMAVTIGSGESLDAAIRDTAENGPPGLSAVFKSVVTEADCRICPDLREGLETKLGTMPATMKPFVRAMNILIAASDSTDSAERARMTKDASDISLTGLKEMGASYSSMLNTPCMLIFGIGIMVPMILMSILPMLSMGGMFGAASINPMIVTLITLVVIPSAVALVIISLNSKNPFVDLSEKKNDIKTVLPLLIGIPVGVMVWIFTEDVYNAIIFGGIASGTLAFICLAPGEQKNKTRKQQESALKDGMFELGNQMISGANFETAVVKAVGSRKECLEMSESLSRELVLCRGDEYKAIKESLSPCSSKVSDLYCNIRKSAEKDLRDAGRLAMSVGRQLQDQESVRKDIDNKLKSMLDMMMGTAVLFAPLVLGMSVSMLAPLAGIAGAVDPVGTTLTLAIYLIELCGLMAVLTSSLTGNSGLQHIVYRFGMMLPIALVVFTVSTGISF